MSRTLDAVSEALVPVPAADAGNTSTALVDGLKAFCDLLADGGPLFTRWRAHPAARGGWQEKPWGAELDLRILAELRGAEFGRLDVGQQRLAHLAAAAAELGRVGVSDGLHGGAAELVRTQVDKFAATARAWQDGLTVLATAVDGAGKVAEDGLKELVDGVAKDHKAVDDMAKRTAQIDRLDEAMSSGTRWGQTFPVDVLRTPGACDLNHGAVGDPWPSSDVINYLDDYCARYDVTVGKFRRDLHTVHEATARAWLTLGDLVRGVNADKGIGTQSTGAASAGGTGESVTIRDSGHAITVEQPGADGKTRLSVDGKQYVIDGTAPAGTAKPADAAAKDSHPGGASAGGGGGSHGAGAGAGAGAGGGGIGGSAGAGAEASPLAEGGSTGAGQIDEQPRQPAASGGSAGAAHGGAPAGGGMPMGGMGGMGAGGQGGDTERKASKWRVAGSLFDDRDPMASFDGVIGADPAAKAKK